MKHGHISDTMLVVENIGYYTFLDTFIKQAYFTYDSLLDWFLYE